MERGHEGAGRLYKGVMVSSTVKDIAPHRETLIRIIESQELRAIAMEHDDAKPDVDVIDSSLQMVSDASAYIAVIGCSYGQIPRCPRRNPDNLSLVELEFNQARRLGKPILLFLMGNEHEIKQRHIEHDPARRAKLEAFRENAKQFQSESPVHRVYKEFESLQEFEGAAARSVAALKKYLDRHDGMPVDPIRVRATPPPPQFHAEPPYIGSHEFVGREPQLGLLSQWAAASDPAPILLFDAIGGTGKSMLTWEWVTKHAANVRSDWAGRFWYSFYEKGATMADFCRRALAYITESPHESFRRKKISDLSRDLVIKLRSHPWLLVLDGFERVLVAYHRHDAAQLTDEDADTAVDQIAQRHPCDAIRPDDDELLRYLAAASPSKLLITSRLLPRVLLNPSGRPIRGVRHELLPGLEPAAAEALIRSCDVHGTPATIRNYLQSHCNNHPLVIGIVAGLVNYYMPNRGNFDAWAVDPNAGGHLDLGGLNLVQKRNHILKIAFEALSPASRELLSTLALLSESVDDATIVALNPHVQAQPEEDSERLRRLKREHDAAVAGTVFTRKAAQRYREELKNAQDDFSRAMEAWRENQRQAPRRLEETVRDLESRGLLQYDSASRRYDLHPVVRGVAVSRLAKDEKERHGARVIDLFSQKAHDPYKDAESVDDVRIGLRLMQTMLQIGRYRDAYAAYNGDLSNALFFNLEAFAEVLAMLQPFFPDGWDQWPTFLPDYRVADLANDAAYALSATGAHAEAVKVYETLLRADPKLNNWRKAWVYLVGMAVIHGQNNRLTLQSRCLAAAREIADVAVSKRDARFAADVHWFAHLALVGRWEEAEAAWEEIRRMGFQGWPRASYRPGTAEWRYAQWKFWCGKLKEIHLESATAAAMQSKTRTVVREIHALRGEWHISTKHWDLAAESLHHAVRMAREMGRPDEVSEVYLVLAKFRLNQLADPVAHAEQLSATPQPAAQLPLAELWSAIGALDRAAAHGRAAYEWAWADGEPYSRRHLLNASTKLLQTIGTSLPDMPAFDRGRHAEMSWERPLAEAVQELRAAQGLRPRRA